MLLGIDCLLFIGNRIFPVIGFDFVASHHTAASGFCCCVGNGKHPVNLPVRDLGPDVFFLVSRMDFMTGLTASSFFPVYMEKVKVKVPIATISEGFSELLCGHFIVVTTKTQGVVFYAVGKIIASGDVDEIYNI